MSSNQQVTFNAPIGQSTQLAPTALLKTQAYTTQQNMLELARFDVILNDMKKFQSVGIFNIMEKHAEMIRQEIQENAPYDFQELDDYHMKDHMVRRDYTGSLGKGQEVESEAPYSGLLEYGTASHGVQYVFFRPAVERGWGHYMREAIEVVKRLMSI